MADQTENLSPADPADLADTLAFALQFDGRKRKHGADSFMATITAKHLVEHLTRSGFVVLKKPPLSGHSQLGSGRRE